MFLNHMKAKVFPIHKKVTLVYYLTKCDYCTVMIPLQNNLQKHIPLQVKAKSSPKGR